MLKNVLLDRVKHCLRQDANGEVIPGLTYWELLNVLIAAEEDLEQVRNTKLYLTHARDSVNPLSRPLER